VDPFASCIADTDSWGRAVLLETRGSNPLSLVVAEHMSTKKSRQADTNIKQKCLSSDTGRSPYATRHSVTAVAQDLIDKLEFPSSTAQKSLLTILENNKEALIKEQEQGIRKKRKKKGKRKGNANREGKRIKC